MDIPSPHDVFDEASALHDDVLDALHRLVEVPSVAGSVDAAEVATSLIAALCRDAGFDHVELWRGDGAPALYAETAAPDGAPTILFYGHYDVQPPEPVSEWDTPPFEPIVRDGALYGRGAGDNKGQFVAHIFAVRALRAAGGCPVGIKLLVEGEEEMGSPHLAATVAAHRERLDCDVAITADGPYHADGHPLIILGVRGLLYLDVIAEGAARDFHSGAHGGIAPAPARTLVRALGALWDQDGRVAVPGFHDSVRTPSNQERELADRLPPFTVPGVKGMRADGWARVMFEPNLNVAGLDAGYTGAGVKTVIPHRAEAKIDVRLVADQDPDEIYELLHAFLGERGVETRCRAAVPPSRTRLDNPFTEPVRAAVARAWGREPLVQPCLGGTTPDFVFTRTLGVPSLLVPYAPADMCHHAANERMPLEALYRGVRTSAAMCLELASV